MMSPDGDEVSAEALLSVGGDWGGVGGVTVGNGCITMGPGVGVVTLGPGVGVMSTSQTDRGVALVEVIVTSHSICDAAVEIEESEESPVDQKLALREKPVRSASIANATSERAMVYRFGVPRVRRCRYTATLGFATTERCTKGVTTGCCVDDSIDPTTTAAGNTSPG